MLNQPADELIIRPTQPRPEYMAAQANHKRRKIRPTDPDNLEFDIDNDHMPADFLQ